MGRSGGEAGPLALAVLLLALPAWGQPGSVGRPEGDGRFGVSATAGAGFPSDTVFRDAYGGTVVPVAAQVDWRLTRSGLGVFGGVRRVSSAGEPMPEGPAGLAGGERLEFSMTSWRVGPSWRVLRGRWGVAVGAGLAFHSYREEWPSAGLLVEDSGVGAMFQGTLERALGRRVSALVRLEYAPFSADPPEDTGLASVGLGGLDLVGGVKFRF